MSLNKTFAEYLQWQSKEKMNSSAQAAIADNAIDQIPKEVQSVLCIGIGDGYEIKRLKEIGIKQVTGITLNLEAVRFHRSLVEKMDMHSMQYPDNSFDLVFAKDVLHHTQNPQKLLTEALRLTKKGGKVVSIEASRYNPLLYFHMTLLRGHQHLKRKDFKDTINKVKGKNKVRFFEFEAHVFPFPERFRKICYFFQNWLEKALFWRPFLSYNGAVIEKKGD